MKPNGPSYTLLGLWLSFLLFGAVSAYLIWSGVIRSLLHYSSLGDGLYGHGLGTPLWLVLLPVVFTVLLGIEIACRYRQKLTRKGTGNPAAKLKRECFNSRKAKRKGKRTAAGR